MRCDHPYRAKDREGNDIPVICGQCPPCKKRRLQEWIFRLRQEDKRSRSGYFITLTYDMDSVPISPRGFMTLYKTDPSPKKYLHVVENVGGDFVKKRVVNPDYDPNYIRRSFPDFMKRLRRITGNKFIKFFAVGEYGSERKRPHYHAIIFNLDPRDCIEAGLCPKGYMRYVNRKVNKAWPFGAVDITAVSGLNIAYTCKYLDKPRLIPAFKDDDRVPEFCLMSRGLGENYLTPQIVDYHKADLNRNYCVVEGGYKVPLSKYYRDRIFDDLDKAEQRSIIVAKYDEMELKQRSDFHNKYGDDLSFEDYKDELKRDRYRRFYRSQKRRSYD